MPFVTLVGITASSGTVFRLIFALGFLLILVLVFFFGLFLWLGLRSDSD